MQSTRAAARAQRALRFNSHAYRRQIRFASESAKPQTPAGSGAITGGLVGGGAALAVGYAWYHFSGASSAVQTAKQAKNYADSATDVLKVKFEEKTPNTDDALQTLRETANKYAAFVPGGRSYVDSAFRDVDSIRQQHGAEVDKIVRELYDELRDVSKQELSLTTLSNAGSVLSKHLQRIFALAGDAAEQILDNHPQLKEKVGGSADQLRQLGERLGPQAKQEVDETWKEVNEIVQKGIQADTVENIRKLVQEKSEKIEQIGERAFDEQIKPLLDQSPKVKQVAEENLQTLKQGNMMQIVSMVRSAVSSGHTGDLEKYIQQ